MLRFKVLASAIPLMIVAVLARGALVPGPRPCIAVADTSVEIADLPWHADLHVAFTDDPALATVRVQTADNPEAADFVVVDDIDSAEGGACEANAATRTGWRSPRRPAGNAPVIFCRRRPSRLPHLRAIEDVFRARCGGAGRRRRRRPPSVEAASL